ncbi:hypothetical protein Rcae01_01456 [Novipirellula caenicola]|uniref:Uncharacterized protein n=1 Tax=Novipirellula caenicola TaxID=1536901 RepID=A0ABP9VMK3_9BACT
MSLDLDRKNCRSLYVYHPAKRSFCPLFATANTQLSPYRSTRPPLAKSYRD